MKYYMVVVHLDHLWPDMAKLITIVTYVWHTVVNSHLYETAYQVLCEYFYNTCHLRIIKNF